MADEQVKKYIDKAKNEMESSVVFLDESLAHIRAGKANTKILDGIKVDYYGTPTPLTSVATVTTPDANNGEIVRLAIPPLTEERRRQLVKQAGTAVEDAKISVRNSRREAIEALKKEIKNGMSEDIEKDAEAEVQKLHDKYIKRLEELFALKEKEIMTV